MSAYVEDTSERELPLPDGRRAHNIQPRVILELSDCSGRVSYELEVHSALALENGQHLLEVIIAALRHVLETIPEEAFLYQERQVLIERHNAEISDDEVPF